MICYLAGGHCVGPSSAEPTGHTQQFKIYDVDNGVIVASEVVDTNGSGHGALAGVLKGLQVEVLICGGIGGRAQMALANAGIKLYDGVSGQADRAVLNLIAGNLAFNPNVQCNHHGEHHYRGIVKYSSTTPFGLLEKLTVRFSTFGILSHISASDSRRVVIKHLQMYKIKAIILTCDWGKIGANFTPFKTKRTIKTKENAQNLTILSVFLVAEAGLDPTTSGL